MIIEDQTDVIEFLSTCGPLHAPGRGLVVGRGCGTQDSLAAELALQRLVVYSRAVCPAAPVDPLTLLATRTIDLRSEFEAQLRAVVRLEEQLRKNREGRDPSGRNLKTLLSRVLAEMLANNANIREVLKQIEAETRITTTAPS